MLLYPKKLNSIEELKLERKTLKDKLKVSLSFTDNTIKVNNNADNNSYLNPLLNIIYNSKKSISTQIPEILKIVWLLIPSRAKKSSLKKTSNFIFNDVAVGYLKWKASIIIFNKILKFLKSKYT